MEDFQGEFIPRLAYSRVSQTTSAKGPHFSKNDLQLLQIDAFVKHNNIVFPTMLIATRF